MIPNVGSTDRILRIVVGALLILLGLLAGLVGFWKWLAVIVGLVLVATALFRFCPAYRLLGMNTCERR
ncbi:MULTISPECIES: YgaP family membrane protein [unclassified Paracoccus (in: a-proteobacteria)]|uniref:YgaP family membrane protein n=1 Tax=unclassified Paracoccus (in: a-proteobacteria) TaxID=2688777 RepID=UPI0012B40A6D|nr:MULTISPECIES: DUF2892 domain-containing protein [unclassified Paracoccus (in: a-proteobacteria)]UXU75012.1 DUF2892 domain-containing protein [Paracoccus sp. SMMA_5]UXU80915.1 DUF2892 domain-containing protein [Paracoccus sp. SMMA_5_TC]